MTDMAGFAHGLTYAAVPEDVRWILRRSFADTMGVAAIAAGSDMARIAAKGAVALFGVGGAGAARMLMDGRAVSPAGAAMAGAMLVDAVDAHDTTSENKGHIGSAAFPALLAVADAMRAQGRPVTGAEFMAWLAVAYEVASRAGQVQHATCADYHTSGAWTAVGVAAAVARMLGADADRTPRGDNDLPLSDAEMSAKFHGFADAVVGAARAGRIEAACLRFDDLDADGFAALLDDLLAGP